MIIYTHTHHIIPRHAGGNNAPSNLIVLTVKEHAEAHKKLWEEYGRWQDEVAWKALSKRITIEQACREASSKTHKGKKLSKEQIEKLRNINLGNKYNLGRKISDKQKTQVSNALKGNKNALGSKSRLGQYNSLESRTKMSISMMNNKNRCGKKHSAASRMKMSASAFKRNT
jgi:hypothetical protein